MAALRRSCALLGALLALTCACAAPVRAQVVVDIPPPIYGLDKAQLCAMDVDRSSFALDLVQVRPERRGGAAAAGARGGYPRILCIVNTISVHHASRAQAVADTWGQRCDELVFFSNASDTIVVGAGSVRERRFEVVALDVPADHNHLWQKHKATLRYVHARFRHAFDWFYKADDDAFVVLENLRAYLRRPEILMGRQREPMQMGHRFNLTQELVSYYIVDHRLEAAWRSRWDRWVFNSGGPGYAMNLLYLDAVVARLEDWTCLSDAYSEMLPDDASISFCMMWRDVYPWDTRDLRGRERWHADKPKGVFFRNPNMDVDPEYWYGQYHRMIGGVRWGRDGAAPDTVAFHYVSPELMYHVERTLYWCRTPDDVHDLRAFNDRFDLAVGDKAAVYQDVPHKRRREQPAADDRGQ